MSLFISATGIGVITDNNNKQFCSKTECLSHISVPNFRLSIRWTRNFRSENIIICHMSRLHRSFSMYETNLNPFQEMH